MKNLGFTIAAVLFAGTAFSQNVVPDNGKVGLGTTTPQEQLHVKGNVKIDSVLHVDGNTGLGGTLSVSKKTMLNQTGILGPLEVQDSSLFEGEVTVNDILKSNATFIGNGKNDFNGASTFNNNVKFNDVQGLSDPLSSYFLFLDADGNTQKSDIPSFTTGFATAIYSLPCLTDQSGNTLSPKWNNGTNKIYSLCANVGIGTNTPLYKLDVRGQGYFEKGIHIGTTTPSNQIINNQAFVDVETISNTTPFIRFSHKSGTNAPQTRFRVENDGRLYCTSVYVSWPDSIPVPDYVFNPAYKLLPLADLKAYVSKNHHLPNIPSEAEIKADGLNVQDMQGRLLEKVEELTLYVIGLNESNEELKKTNEILMQEIEALKALIIKN